MKRVKGTHYYHNRHSCFVLTYHLVLVTKFRKPILTGALRDMVYNTIEEIVESHDCRLLAINGEEDHVHVLFEAGPNEALVTLVNVIKTQTAKLARRDYIDQLNKWYWEPLFWSNSYFISSVGSITKSTVTEYINNQGTED